MSMCGHCKKPCVNDVDVAGSPRADESEFMHIHLLWSHSDTISCPPQLCTAVIVITVVSACLLD